MPGQLVDVLGMVDQPSLYEGGGHAPLNVVRGEAAPLGVGGEQGEVAGLPGLGESDRGIGQGAKNSSR